ncbi:hypothetical protein QTI33_15635 [Variovorax sp. J22P271]|uniref:hypothetical protein n=1 Tax=Variovorax davisae TaxID=3053515 RepID=UPI002576DCE9|nr:hypothetical protein [Variovorax sp. J22P271]MDM0033564.1 hypothetical protein [Variovorax sp. J22P271]
MSVEFLRQIAGTPLPQAFHAAADIDAIRSLRRAGWVLALMDEPPERAARVLAITEEGRNELLRFHYPDEPLSRPRVDAHWLQLAARRARQALLRADAPGTRDGR